MQRPFSERRIRSLRELRKVVDSLDLDEGVRVLGRFEELRGGGFIFINKSSNLYCVNTAERIYSEEMGTHVPGGREEFLYFKTAEETIRYVEKNAAKPLEAWSY